MNDVDVLDSSGADNLHFVHGCSDSINWVQYLGSIR